MTQLTNLSGESSIVGLITSTLPKYFKKIFGSSVYNICSAFATIFQINIDQINQMFNNTFISQSSGTVLVDLITDISDIYKKDGESDEDYRNRYYRYVYEYNCTVESVRQQVYDVMGYYSLAIYESGARSAYWGEADLPTSGQISGTATYYDDIPEYTVYWSGDISEEAFTAYIYLATIPSQEIINELCNVIERVRLRGTTIYLMFPDPISPPEDFIMFDIT